MADKDTSPTVKKSIRIKNSIWDKIEAAAEANELKPSGYITKVLQEHIELSDEIRTIKVALDELASQTRGGHSPEGTSEVAEALSALTNKVEQQLEALTEVPVAFEKLCESFADLHSRVNMLVEDAEVITVNEAGATH